MYIVVATARQQSDKLPLYGGVISACLALIRGFDLQVMRLIPGSVSFNPRFSMKPQQRPPA